MPCVCQQLPRSDTFVHPRWQTQPSGHPCHTQDLVLPSMKPPEAFADSPLAGAPARPRTWLALHRGRVGVRSAAGWLVGGPARSPT